MGVVCIISKKWIKSLVKNFKLFGGIKMFINCMISTFIFQIYSSKVFIVLNNNFSFVFHYDLFFLLHIWGLMETLD